MNGNGNTLASHTISHPRVSGGKRIPRASKLGRLLAAGDVERAIELSEQSARDAARTAAANELLGLSRSERLARLVVAARGRDFRIHSAAPVLNLEPAKPLPAPGVQLKLF